MSTLVSVLCTASILLLWSGVQLLRTPGYDAQLAPFGYTREQRKSRTRYERWVRPYAKWLADHASFAYGLFNREKIARELDYAGNPENITAHEFFGIQLYCFMAGILYSMFWFPITHLGFLFFPILGFAIPLLWLKGWVQQRQLTIARALPDFLDLLAACVTAGLGSDIAFALITKRGKGPLYEEFERLLRELSIGESRERAFRHIGQRNSAPELRSFINALLDGGELGTPIAHILQRLAEDMRSSRRARARETANRVINRLSLLIMFAVVPTVALLMIASILALLRILNGITITPQQL